MFPEIELPNPEPPKLFLGEKRRLLFVYVPVFTFVFVALSLVFGENKGIERLFDIVLTLGLNVFAFVWCRFDSTERRYQLSRLFGYAVVIFGTLALIYYLFRSRGFLGGLRSVGWLLLYAVLLFLTTSILSAAVVLLLVVIGVVSPSVLS